MKLSVDYGVSGGRHVNNNEWPILMQSLSVVGELDKLIEAAREVGADVEVTTVLIRFGGGSATAVEPEVVEAPEAPEAPEAERALKVAEWGRQLDRISARELERAIEAGVIETRPKGHGRDHLATVIEPAEIKVYARLCERVQAGEEPKPEWWHNVRKGSNADTP